MGSLVAEPRNSLESALSLDRTISNSTEGMDVEFDAVVLDAAEFVEAHKFHFQSKGPASATGEVIEWLEAAVFGEDEDFGALLVEPLRARVALGPIYDEIFGNAGGVNEPTRNAGGVNTARKSPGDENVSHWQLGGSIGRWGEKGLSGQAATSVPEREASAQTLEEFSLADVNALETVVGIIQNVFQEDKISAEELGGPVLKGQSEAAPSEVPSSWAAVVGSRTTRAPRVDARHARKPVSSKQRASILGGPGMSFLLMDALPGRGFQVRRPSRQGLAAEGGGSLSDWGPVKEERNPRLKAGKCKSHGPRKGSPPPRRMGNFGTGKFCSMCSPALSNRLHKKVDSWRECMAGDLSPG